LEALPSILKREPNSQTFLVMFGMNDAAPWLPIPSGQGLNPGDSGYAGSYKDSMQQIINQLKSAGKKIVLAKVNFAANEDARDTLIQQYNVVVDEFVSNPANGITVTPPDFYAIFTNNNLYQTQYGDNIHPNGAGYQTMANGWFQALTQ
jgi:lysophospholipase L1-like esterase